MAKWWILALLLLVFSGASSRSIVNNLPGFGDLPFKLETGYIGVGEAEDVQLFYYFVESERNPMTDPILVWLLGGPGCSGLSGFFYENGPLMFKEVISDGCIPELRLNPDTWTKKVNMLYVDTPVMSGFSYSRTQQGYYTSDAKWVQDAYDFLQKWLIDHSEFAANPLYIGGGSYAGIIVPPLVQKVYEGYKAGRKPLMNIQGYMLASPKTDLFLDENLKAQFAHQLTLISDDLYQSIKASCNGDYINIDSNNTQCVSDHEAYSELVRGIYRHQVMEPNCIGGSPEDRRILFEESKTISKFWCRDLKYMLIRVWANDLTVRKALNVKEGTKEQFQRCNRSYSAYTTNIPSVIQYHRNLTSTSLRSLIFCGDLDMAIPHLAAQSWIKSLNLKVNKTWHAWFVDGQVAGYTETYGKNEYQMTYATVKGTGHVAHRYKPKEVYELIDGWFSHNSI